jgi:hypothetical protein
MKAAGKTYDPVTYDGAGHGFMRAGEAPDASDANKKARDNAWKRWNSLLARYLGQEIPSSRPACPVDALPGTVPVSLVRQRLSFTRQLL